MSDIKHLHQIIIGEVSNPPKDVELTKDWMKSLVEKIGMKRLIEPQAVYVEKAGNRGMTSCVLIETSHIAWHVWDEKDPALLQFDLYTCGDLDSKLVTDEVHKFFGLGEYSMNLFDRANGDLEPLQYFWTPSVLVKRN